MRISSVGTALPQYRYSQAEVTGVLRKRWEGKLAEPRLLDRLHASCGVEYRNFVLPLEAYLALRGFTAKNGLWISAAVELAQTCIERALTPLGLTAADVSAIFFASATGIAGPAVDSRLINLMPFPAIVKRTPIFGLGCVAGVAGISRAADYVRAFPREIAILLSVEMCSLMWQEDDQSIANLVSTGLFGDGAAAVVMTGDEVVLPDSKLAAGPRVRATRSMFYRDTEQTDGWEIGARGPRVCPDVPKAVTENLYEDVGSFLADNGIGRGEIASWIFHSGGPNGLEAVESALELPEGAFAGSWKSLREVGNVSTASVLMVLADTLKCHRGAPGSYSILAGMGPGFCVEFLLLQWP
jgi:alkylresorcinol/alkylpyrone synthase